MTLRTFQTLYWKKKLLGKTISLLLHNFSTPFVPKDKHLSRSKRLSDSHPHPQNLSSHLHEQKKSWGNWKTRALREGGCGQLMSSGEGLHEESTEDGCSQKDLISWQFSRLWLSRCNSCARAGRSLPSSLPPTSSQLLHLQTILQTSNGPSQPRQLHLNSGKMIWKLKTTSCVIKGNKNDSKL